MHSTAIILSLLAGSVLSSPARHGHEHIHARQVEVVDVVDVYTTVTIGGPAPTPVHHKSKPAVKHVEAAAAPAPEEKLAEPVHVKPVAVSTPPPPPPVQSSPPPPPAKSPAAAPATDSAPSSGNDYLKYHNQYRANHGAGEMVWDDALASKAQSQVNSCPENDVQ